MAQYAIVLLALGGVGIFAGIMNVRNIRRAIRTGTVSGKGEAFNRAKNPILYKITFGGSVFAGIVGFIFGAGCIGLAIALLFFCFDL